MTGYSQQILEHQGVCTVRAQGHLDARTAPDLEIALAGLLERSVDRVVLDLEGLSYISSAGLGILAGMLGTFRDRGGDLKLAATPPGVLRVLDLLGFTRLLEVYDTCQSAVEAFARPGEGGPLG